PSCLETAKGQTRIMKVICTLPNASELISGVRFVSHAEGMISEEISEEVAARFLCIPGYKPAPAKSLRSSASSSQQATPSVPSEKNGTESPGTGRGDGTEGGAEPPRPAPEPSSPPSPPEGASANEPDELEVLREEAAALGLKADRRWGAARLRAEIKAAKAG